MSQEAPITVLTTRVRQMILEYKELRKKHYALKGEVETLNGEIDGLKQQLAQEEKRYETLMTAKMLNVTDRDINNVKQRINKLQRSVTHCITLLSEQEEMADDTDEAK